MSQGCFLLLIFPPSDGPSVSLAVYGAASMRLLRFGAAERRCNFDGFFGRLKAMFMGVIRTPHGGAWLMEVTPVQLSCRLRERYFRNAFENFF